MLTDSKIKKAISSKEIEILVSFGSKNSQPCTYEKAQPLLNSSLKGNLYSDRLKLTMGPIVKVLSGTPVPRKYRFKHRTDCFDLRCANNKFIIKPGESIILLTNEAIKLNGRYACLILPRISLSDVGLVVSTAYVDPFYEGLMRLHLTNLSQSPYELKFLEAIAQCFFFEMTEAVGQMYKEQFPQKSVFFGQTWKEILSTEREPFPTKKSAIPANLFGTLRHQLSLMWKELKKHSITIGMILNISALFGGWIIFKNDFSEYTQAVAYIQEWMKPISSEIYISQGDTYGEKTITVNYAKADIISVLCNNDDIHYKLSSGETESQTVVHFTYYLDAPAHENHEINFSYIIVRRSEK